MNKWNRTKKKHFIMLWSIICRREHIQKTESIEKEIKRRLTKLDDELEFRCYFYE